MLEEKTWEEFRGNGFIWVVNQFLHLFGWAIVISLNDDGEIARVFPARVKFRGFSEEINDNGYVQVSKYIKDNADSLYIDVVAPNNDKVE